MNDYLSNLLARSLEQTEGVPLVGPRVPSLFEPLQEPWSHSPEIRSWPPASHRQNDAETSSFSSSEVGEDSKGLDQVTEKSIHRDTTPNMTSEDVPHPHRRPMQTVKGTSENDPQSGKPALEHPPRPDPRTVIVKKTSAKPSDDGSPQSAGQGDVQEPATNRTVIPISVYTVPTSKEDEGPLSVRRRRKEGAGPPPGKVRKDHLVVEKVIAKGGKRVLDRNRSPAAEAEEHHDLSVPPMIPPPPEQTVEPVFYPRMNSGYPQTPAPVEPVIHVTIGRVEVRAIMSPQRPAGKSEKPVPAMGLEEYLRRRSGGRD